MIFCNFQSKYIFNKKLFDFAEILHAGQPIHVNVSENRDFDNPSRFAQDMIFFPRKLSELPQNDHFKNGQKMHQYWSQNPEIKIFDFRMTIHEGYSYFCPAVYAFCILKFSLQPILAPKKIGQKWPFSAKFRPNFFGPNLAERKILLCNWHSDKNSSYIFFFIYYW